MVQAHHMNQLDTGVCGLRREREDTAGNLFKSEWIVAGRKLSNGCM